MSRVTYNEMDDVYAVMAYGRWLRNSKQVLVSRRGQAALREIETALLALPKPRLARDTFCATDEFGEVEACVLGAYALYKGVPGEQMKDVNPYWSRGDWYGSAGADVTAEWAEKHLGLANTLAWNLVGLNDEEFGHGTPEQRYTRMLAWVREHIEPSEADLRESPNGHRRNDERSRAADAGGDSDPNAVL